MIYLYCALIIIITQQVLPQQHYTNKMKKKQQRITKKIAFYIDDAMIVYWDAVNILERY